MKLKRLFSLFLTLYLLMSSIPAVASADSGWMSECKPYQYTSATEYTPTIAEGFTIGGKTYYEGYVFYCWYQSSLSQVLYNLKGEYKTFEFDIGRVDGTRVAPSKLYVYKEGLIEQSIDLNPNALKTHITLDVEGVNSLKLVCETQGHYYDVYYGVFNGKWTASGKKAPAVANDPWIYDCAPYDSTSTDFFYAKDGQSILMGGDAYSDAVRMYLWNPARPISVSYNLSGDFKSFSCLFGHVDSTTRATGVLTVKLDGIINQTITQEPDSLPVPVNVDLTGVDQMILEFSSPNPLNTYYIYYGIGSGKFVSNGNVRAVYLSDSEIQFKEGFTTYQLQADVRPRDAVNKNVTWSSSDTSVATVSSSGKVTAVGAGTAEISVVTADGKYKATCSVTVPEDLELTPNLSITKQPTTGYAKSGKTVSVSVKAEGEGLTYQWYVKNSGASKYSKSSITKATYSCTMSSTTRDRLVYCIVTDQDGNTVKSNTVRLRMAATITKQPTNASAAAGSTAKTSLTAMGDGLTYQWYVKNPGKTTFSKSSITKATYSCTMSSSTDGRQVYCIVTDKYGKSDRSETVTFGLPVKIATQPKTGYAQSGETVSVSLKADGDGLKYQWYVKNDGATKYSKSSITSATYSCTMTSKVRDRLVYCVVTDQYGNTAKSNTVRLRMAASITTQPVSVTVDKGDTAKVSLKAAGDGLTYKWYYKNDGDSKYTYTSSFKGNSYSVTMSASRDGRKVYCIVTDKYGNQVKSKTVSLNMD